MLVTGSLGAAFGDQLVDHGLPGLAEGTHELLGIAQRGIYLIRTIPEH